MEKKLNKNLIIEKYFNETKLHGALVISKKYKTIYFHIGKTGGTSITHTLRKYGYDDNIISNRNINIDEKLKYFEEVAQDWENYYKFTFVRNKLTQLKSLYNMDTNINYFQKKLNINNPSFEEFIFNFIDNPMYANNQLWMDQYELTHINDKCIFNFIGYFENYEEDLHKIITKLNLKKINLKENVGNYKKKKLEYTTEMIEKVKNTYPKEFEYFQWKI